MNHRVRCRCSPVPVSPLPRRHPYHHFHHHHHTQPYTPHGVPPTSRSFVVLAKSTCSVTALVRQVHAASNRGGVLQRRRCATAVRPPSCAPAPTVCGPACSPGTFHSSGTRQVRFACCPAALAASRMCPLQRSVPALAPPAIPRAAASTASAVSGTGGHGSGTASDSWAEEAVGRPAPTPPAAAQQINDIIETGTCATLESFRWADPGAGQLRAGPCNACCLEAPARRSCQAPVAGRAFRCRGRKGRSSLRCTHVHRPLPQHGTSSRCSLFSDISASNDVLRPLQGGRGCGGLARQAARRQRGRRHTRALPLPAGSGAAGGQAVVGPGLQVSRAAGWPDRPSWHSRRWM